MSSNERCWDTISADRHWPRCCLLERLAEAMEYGTPRGHGEAVVEAHGLARLSRWVIDSHVRGRLTRPLR